jgi:hypothetical protein
MDVAEIRPGLWRWTAPHPAWRPGKAWPEEVGCVYAETQEASVLVDPLVPADDEERFWQALDRDRVRLAHLPVRVLLTCSWHRRSSDVVAERYDAEVWQPGDALPHGVEVAVFADSDTGWREAVFALHGQTVVVFGDVIEADESGRLRMPPNWWPPHEKRTTRIRTELRRMLDWPVEAVLVSHGEPVLERARIALAQALEM